MCPEVILENWVEGDVTLVVAEQIQLNLVGARARQIEVVERIAVRRDRAHVGHTMCVLPARRVGREETAKRVSVGLRRVLPISPNGIPAVAQPFLVGVAVLGDDCSETVRMPNGETEPHRRAVVEDVDREARETDHLGEAIDDVCDILERVSESIARRHVGLAKRREVGSNEVKPVRELRDELAEHVAGSRKAVQQEDRWRFLRPGLAVENADAVDIHLLVRDHAQERSFRSIYIVSQPSRRPDAVTTSGAVDSRRQLAAAIRFSTPSFR